MFQTKHSKPNASNQTFGNIQNRMLQILEKKTETLRHGVTCYANANPSLRAVVPLHAQAFRNDAHK